MSFLFTFILLIMPDHLVRHLVDWYQRNERENRNNPALTETAPEDESARIRTSNPCDSLIYSTAVIPKLVSEGKADIIIDTLRSYSQLPYVDKEALVRYAHCNLALKG